jgi:uroporphyrinogen-III synthase
MIKLFISKKVNVDDYFVQQLKLRGITCVGESFLRFELLSELPARIDSKWVFFSSPTAVELYKKAYPNCNKSWAALGSGTAKGNEMLFNFVGSGNDFKVIAEKFNLLPNSHSVTLISAFKGNRSMLPFLNKNAQCLSLYETIEIPSELPKATAFIFTSPSNARAASVLNDLSKLHVACLGESTRVQLQKLGAVNIYEFNSWIWDELVEEIDAWLTNL